MKLTYLIISLLSLFALGQQAQAQYDFNYIKEGKTPTVESNLNEITKSLFDNMFFNAIEQKHKGQYNEAFQSFQTCLQLDSTSSAVYYEMSKLLSGAAVKDALYYALQAVKYDLNKTDNKNYLEQAIVLCMQTGNLDTTLALFDQLLNIEPENTNYRFQKIYWLIDKNLFNHAMSELDKFPANVNEEVKYSIEATRASIYISVRDYKKSIKVLNKTEKLYPNRARTGYLLFYSYAQLKKNNEAREKLIEATERPGGHEYLFTLANNVYLVDKMDSLFAKTSYKAYSCAEIPVETKVEMISNTLQDQTLMTPQWAPVIKKILSIVREMYPSETAFLQLEATYIGNSKLTPKVIKLYQKFLDKYPGNYAIWNDFLSCYDGPADSALVYIKKACEDVPDYIGFQLRLGGVYLMLGDYAQGIATGYAALDNIYEANLTKAVADQFRGNAYNVLAECYYRTQNIDSCFFCFDQVVKLLPNNSIALNNYAYFLAEQNKDLPRAESMAQKAVQYEPLNPTVLDTYAYVLFRQKMYEKALFIMELCLSNAKESDVTYEIHAGDIYYFNGRIDEAVDHWKKAQQFGDNTELLKRKIETRSYHEK